MPTPRSFSIVRPLYHPGRKSIIVTSLRRAMSHQSPIRPPKRFAPLDPRRRSGGTAEAPPLRGIVFDVDGTLWCVCHFLICLAVVVLFCFLRLRGWLVLFGRVFGCIFVDSSGLCWTRRVLLLWGRHSSLCLSLSLSLSLIYIRTAEYNFRVSKSIRQLRRQSGRPMLIYRALTTLTPHAV